MALDDATWWLADAEEKNRAAPRAFFIPPRTHRARLDVGRLVKVALECAPRLVDGARRSGERLWLRIDDAPGDGTYRGSVQGDPTVIAELRAGDGIDFDARHVIAIEYHPGELDYDPAEEAAVDPVVLQRDVPPTRVVRFQPPGQPRPLWFAAQGGEVPPEALLIPLGRLADFWPELAPVFASGGGDWLRHPERPEYLIDTPEHQREVAVGALADAARACLRYTRDPQAASAEQHFENVLEDVIRLHWIGDGVPQSVAHPGFTRGDGHVRLAGVVRVGGAADRPLSVDIHSVRGGELRIGTPGREKRWGRRAKGPAPLHAAEQLISVPGRDLPGLGPSR